MYTAVWDSLNEQQRTTKHCIGTSEIIIKLVHQTSKKNCNSSSAHERESLSHVNYITATAGFSVYKVLHRDQFIGSNYTTARTNPLHHIVHDEECRARIQAALTFSALQKSLSGGIIIRPH